MGSEATKRSVTQQCSSRHLLLAICLEETGPQMDAVRNPVLLLLHGNSNLIHLRENTAGLWFQTMHNPVAKRRT
jgi:hypothetical protein